MDEISLRYIKHSDKEVWSKMLLDYYPPLITRLDESWKMAMNGQVIWTLAEVDGEVAGFSAVVHHVTAFSLGEIMYLSDLYTRPEFRRKGVARALIDDMLLHAKGLNIERVYWVTEHNNPARNLYNQYGRPDFVRYHVDLFGPT